MYSGPIILPAIVEDRARTEPDRPLVRFEDDVLTGGQLHENALRVAQALKALGLKPGDKAALMLDNGREAIEAWFGMTYAGIVEVPINTAFKGDLLTYMLTQAECRAIITKPEFVERIEVDLHVLVVGESYDEALAAAEPNDSFATARLVAECAPVLLDAGVRTVIPLVERARYSAIASGFDRMAARLAL
jgi:crotonobetaine/carnitine-CoA ligase